MDPVIFFPDERFKPKLRVVILVVLAVSILWWSIPLLYIGGYELGGVAVGLALTAVVHVAVVLIALWPVDMYYRSIRYELHEDEVVVIIGVITKSVKHVPFRTVTNLKVARGPFDRMFGLGSLAIQTAGMSGTTGAEENLQGLTDVQDVYERVARELRRFRGAMAPTQAGSELVPQAEANGSGVLVAILDELRAIRAKMDDSE